MSAPVEQPDQDPAPRRQQMNVRLPPDLVESIDARRQAKGLSRDKWVENALRFALAQHTRPAQGTRLNR